MKANTSTSNLTLASNAINNGKNSIIDAKELIITLSSILKDCPSCKSKLIEKVAEGYQPSTPTEQGAITAGANYYDRQRQVKQISR